MMEHRLSPLRLLFFCTRSRQVWFADKSNNGKEAATSDVYIIMEHAKKMQTILPKVRLWWQTTAVT